MRPRKLQRCPPTRPPRPLKKFLRIILITRDSTKIVGDRLSGWSDVFGTSAESTVTGAIATFGVPEEISSVGGPEFTAFVTQNFMRKWDIKHHVFSAYFPQSNSHAEVAVKAGKRLLMSNISPKENLNNDSFLRALWQLRNIPYSDCDISPTEIVLALFARRILVCFIYLFFLFYLYIYPPDSQESDGGAIHRVSNYPDLLPEMPRYCCPLVV